MSEYFLVNNLKFVPLAPQLLNYFMVPDDGIYWQAKHDFQTSFWNFLPRSHKRNKDFKRNAPASALPETVPLKGPAKKDFTPMSEEYQWLWFDLLVLAAGGTRTHAEMLDIWRSITEQSRALTDGLTRESLNPHRDYVLGEQLDAFKDMGIKYLTCGGNVVEQQVRSGWDITIRAIDTRKPAPRAKDIWGDSAIVHFATESTMLELDGWNNWQVSRWTWNRPYGVPFPLLSADGTFIVHPDRFHPISNGKEYSWYNPPMA